MDEHGGQGGTDEKTEILADLANVKLHQVGQNQEEDTDRGHRNEELDDLGDDTFNLLGNANDGRARGFDEVSDDDGSDDDCQ